MNFLMAAIGPPSVSIPDFGRDFGLWYIYICIAQW
jgi:hypothetical protein